MITRSLTICAAVAATAAGTSLALAQVSPPGPYSSAPAPYPADYNRRPSAMDAMPEYENFEDEDGNPRPHGSMALPPPGTGPVMSPGDPRYGRPLYSDRAPQGPVMSPDDPRYGRPMAQPAYADRAPQGPVMSPDDPRYGRPMGPPAVI